MCGGQLRQMNGVWPDSARWRYGETRSSYLTGAITIDVLVSPLSLHADVAEALLAWTRQGSLAGS